MSAAASSTSTTGLVHYILYGYWEENADPRTVHLPLMSGGPWTMMALMATYVYLCGYLGPAIMKHRRAFVLRGPMLVYNIITVLLNGYFFVVSIYYLNFGLELFNFRFPSRTHITAKDMTMARLGYFYLGTKLLDLADTVFFVLRKKSNQISGLHLYHHSMVPVITWLAVKLASTAVCLGIFPLCNTLIHVIMYSYYALSAVPSLRSYLWWKKYLTQIQLTQFVIYALYMIPFLKYQHGYPVKFWIYVIAPQPLIFFYLFWAFYRAAYKTRPTEEAKEKDL